MMALASLVESKAVRLGCAITAAVALGWLLLSGEEPRVLVDPYERARVHMKTAARTEAIRAERCPRPALREPVVAIDGSPLLRGFIEPSSAEARCLDAVGKQRDKVEPCDPRNCPKLTLAAMTPQPDLVAACATLYDKIAQLAHTTAACSPSSADDFDPLTGPEVRSMLLPFAIKLQVAPLYARGELVAAARHIMNAMRFADDYGRKGYLVTAMISVAVVGMLGEVLVEILTDPRLTADDARAIARELDVLIASAPAIDAVMRQESRFVIARIDDLEHTPYTGNADDDAALQLIDLECWLQRVERACKDKPLRTCLEAHSTQVDPTKPSDRELLPLEIAMGLRGRDLRKRVLAVMAHERAWVGAYPSMFGRRHFVLHSLRMQAELRTMASAECRNPQTRRERLAPWLANGIMMSDKPEVTVVPAAWLNRPTWARTSKSRPRHTLRCIDPR
jgi:hypothetical protein